MAGVRSVSTGFLFHFIEINILTFLKRIRVCAYSARFVFYLSLWKCSFFFKFMLSHLISLKIRLRIRDRWNRFLFAKRVVDTAITWQIHTLVVLKVFVMEIFDFNWIQTYFFAEYNERDFYVIILYRYTLTIFVKIQYTVFNDNAI